MSASKNKPVLSMTGFGGAEGEVFGQRIRIEAKAVNHRFLDLKVRMPRELSSAEMPLRAAAQSRLGRGAVEIKIDRIVTADTESQAQKISTDLPLAEAYYKSLVAIRDRLGLKDEIRTSDVASYPEVISRASSELASDQAWKSLEPWVLQALDQLISMRKHEGANLARVLHATMDEMQAALDRVKVRRRECEAAYKARIHEKIKAVFEAYPIAETSVQTAIESRVAQELAMIIDRTDIEEEIARFEGHVAHFRKTLDEGGAVGRKLDFIVQEMNREINTLGNKAQDFGISEDVVQTKVRIEQLREQVMNLE